MRQIINATQIDEWFISGRRDAQEVFPHLLRKLISATVKFEELKQLRIPVGDQIGLPGFDGVVEIAAKHPYVPFEQSVWEMGTGEPGEKAKADLLKRTRNPRGIDPAHTRFVFATPHPFHAKADFREQGRKNGWKDAVVLDHVDIASWLEFAPAVARWLARVIGVPVDGMRDFDLFIKEFDAQYGVTVSAKLLIGGREESAKEVEEWLDSDSPETAIEGESAEEACAFLTGAIRCLTDAKKEAISSRIIFVDRPEVLD